MTPQVYQEFKALLLAGLSDDGYALDWTSLGVAKVARGKAEKAVRADITAKASGIFFGEALGRAAAAISEEIALPFSVKCLAKEGERLKPGQKVFEWKGSSTGILSIERPFLNLAGYLGGMSTRTRDLVDRVVGEWKKNRSTGQAPRVTSTRKILPHYRDCAIAAVIAGGGYPHRVSLSGGVLIKENHIAAAGGIRNAIRGARSVAPHSLKIEIEVRNATELKDALSEKAEIIMLDNFSPTDVVKVMPTIAASGYSPTIECSGGISEETIANYAIEGVHILSVGGLTHSVKALDLSLIVKR